MLKRIYHQKLVAGTLRKMWAKIFFNMFIVPRMGEGDPKIIEKT
jgi:hypothetical protein